MTLAKNPQSFEEICLLEVGQISRFIYWSNAQYMLRRETIRTESILLRSGYDTHSQMLLEVMLISFEIFHR